MRSGKKNCPANDPAPRETAPEIVADEYFMRAALRAAEKAAANHEVPVGAVAVKNGMIVARAWNQVELRHDATAHAEILVLSALSAALGDWRLDGVTVYVTKEPCAMCAGALVNARVEQVVYGFADPRMGACGSALNITACPGLLHHVKITGGVLREECAKQFKQFFRRVRSGEVPKPSSAGTGEKGKGRTCL